MTPSNGATMMVSWNASGKTSEGPIRHPPGDLAIDLSLRPLRMFASDDLANHPQGEPPQAVRNREPFGWGFRPEDLGHPVVDDLQFWILESINPPRMIIPGPQQYVEIDLVFETQRPPPPSCGQYALASITSPPAIVPRAAQTRASIDSFTNRTEPSPVIRFTPPEWRLVAVTTAWLS